MLRTGICYLFGKGIEQDTIKAYQYFKMAAEKGNADSQYIYGLGCKNTNEKVMWIKKAALQGSVDLQPQPISSCLSKYQTQCLMCSKPCGIIVLQERNDDA